MISGTKWSKSSQKWREKEVVSSGLKGQFNHSVDAKGRLIIPTKLREQLGDTFVITKGLDGCLYGYPDDEWAEFEGKLRKLPMLNKRARQTKDFFMAGAVDCELDSQGRILLPQILRDFAHITKEVAIVGNIERIEIWDLDTWNQRSVEIAENMDEIVEDLDALGIEL